MANTASYSARRRVAEVSAEAAMEFKMAMSPWNAPSILKKQAPTTATLRHRLLAISTSPGVRAKPVTR